MKGYKVTDSNMQCRGFQFELGKKFSVKGPLSLCNNGFHFCQTLAACFNYYSFDRTNRVFEVTTGEDAITEGDKSCATMIFFDRELSWDEVLRLANTGIDNTGHSNSGNWNSGNWNSGNRNSGDSNSGYRNSGAFCLDSDPKMVLFDKPCKSMTVKEWERTRPCQLMSNIDPTIWVPANLMSEQEKADHPKWETTEGYLKTISMKEAWANFWGNLSDKDKAEFTSLENFNVESFESITGIKST